MQRKVNVVEDLDGKKLTRIYNDNMDIKKKRVPISSRKDLTQSKTRFFLS